MSTVTVSSKYQIVIPREMRAALGIRAGTRLHVLNHGGHVVLVPTRPMTQARGFLKGIDTDVPREADRE